MKGGLIVPKDFWIMSKEDHKTILKFNRKYEKKKKQKKNTSRIWKLPSDFRNLSTAFTCILYT